MLHYILHNKKSRHLLLMALLCSTTFSLPSYASKDLVDEEEHSAQKHSSILPNNVRRGALALLNEQDGFPSPQKSDSDSSKQLAVPNRFNFSIFGDLLSGLRDHAPDISGLWNRAPSMKSIKSNAQDVLLFVLNEEKDDQTPQKSESNSTVDPEHKDGQDTANTNASSTALEKTNLESADASVIPTEDDPEHPNPVDTGSMIVENDGKSGAIVETDSNARATESGAPDQGNNRVGETLEQDNPTLTLRTNETFIDPEEGEAQSPASVDAGNKSGEDDAADYQSIASDTPKDVVKEDENPDDSEKVGNADENEGDETDGDAEEKSSSSDGSSLKDAEQSDSEDDAGSKKEDDEGSEGDNDAEQDGASRSDDEGSNSGSDDEGSNSGSDDEGSNSRSDDDSDAREELDEQRTPPQSPYSTPKKTAVPSTPEAHGYKAKTSTPTHGNIYHGLQYTYENPQGREVTATGGRLAYFLGNSPHPNKFKLVSAESPKKDKKYFRMTFDQKKETK
ncbi:MAG: hypothetical protein ACTHJ4_00930 [Candidatus Nucleicultricaceae bacterium]